MTLGDKLSKLRKEANYTQEQFAELLGVSRQSVSKWESDVTYPETEKLIRIGELFDCSLDYLLKDGAEPEHGNQADEENHSFRAHPRERKSKKTLWGMPLWHVGRNARGFVAVGLSARGVIAVGLKARGVVSLGLLSIGALSYGLLSIGLLSIGTAALGLLAAGSLSAGVFSAGAVSFGVISLGAVAVGDFSVGALAVGNHFALGDNARAMIAIGDTQAIGSAFQKIGELTANDINTVKELLDTTVPSYLSWAKEIIMLFL